MGLPAFGVGACVFTFLSNLEKRRAVVCLPGGIWRLLLELPSQQPLPFGPVPARPTKGEHGAKRREEMEASLQRIAAKLGTADRDEFENGNEAWWTRPLAGRLTPRDIISVGNYQRERLKQQLAAIEHARNSDTPNLSEPLGLLMGETIAAHAARAEIVEREKGLLRREKTACESFTKTRH